MAPGVQGSPLSLELFLTGVFFFSSSRQGMNVVILNRGIFLFLKNFHLNVVLLLEVHSSTLKIF